jgi:single-strand DNA-binding protein
MATDINHVVLVGRLTRDAELRYTNNGTAICAFSIGNTYRTKQGENWVEESNFFNCVMFGRRAEALHQYLTKGKQIGIDGALRYSKWEQDGQPRSKVEVHVNDIQLLGGRDGGGRSAGPDRGDTEYSGNQYAGDSSGSDFEDDVPF